MTFDDAVYLQMRGAPIAVRYGGGLNSMAVLLLFKQRGIVPDNISFSDTGDEKPETYLHLQVVERWLARVGFHEMTRLKRTPRNGAASLYEECLINQTLPSRAFGGGSCADKWKVGPFRKFMSSWAPAVAAKGWGFKPIVVLGYDAGEDERAKIDEDDRFLYWHPLIEAGITRHMCREMVLAEGLPVPMKSACWHCPSSKRHEILWLRRTHPELLAKALEMEANAAPNLGSVKGLARNWSWKSLVDADARQVDAFPETIVEDCAVCTEGSCEWSPDEEAA